MTDVTVDRTLVLRVLGLLTDVLTKSGHAKQLVENESRGNCLGGACTARCNECVGLLLAFSDVLEAMDAAEPQQTRMFDEAQP